MTPEQFLAMLENVKQVGHGRWMAKCPAHEDKHASLSVRAAEDGRTLVHDFGMDCDVSDVCAALGIRVSDLMPPRLDRPYMRPEERGTNVTGAVAADILELLAHHATIAVIVCSDLLNRESRALTNSERKHLVEAARVIGGARDTISPVRLKPAKKEQSR